MNCNDNDTAYNCIQVEKDSGKTAEYWDFIYGFHRMDVSIGIAIIIALQQNSNVNYYKQQMPYTVWR